MFTADDAMRLETEALTPAEAAQLLQKAINSGDGWQLQGSFGRSMMQAIDDGRCMLGRHRSRDAYGRPVPARDEVKEGGKGSRQYVVDRMGPEWAAMLEALDSVVLPQTPPQP